MEPSCREEGLNYCRKLNDILWFSQLTSDGGDSLLHNAKFRERRSVNWFASIIEISSRFWYLRYHQLINLSTFDIEDFFLHQKFRQRLGQCWNRETPLSCRSIFSSDRMCLLVIDELIQHCECKFNDFREQRILIVNSSQEATSLVCLSSAEWMNRLRRLWNCFGGTELRDNMDVIKEIIRADYRASYQSDNNVACATLSFPRPPKFFVTENKAFESETKSLFKRFHKLDLETDQCRKFSRERHSRACCAFYLTNVSIPKRLTNWDNF